MTEQFEDHDAHKEAILAKAGFSRPVKWMTHVAKDVAMTALKGAVIMGLVLVALSLVVTAPAGLLAGGINMMFGSQLAWGSAGMIAAATQGAIVGAVAGAAIGLVKGFSGADDAVEDQEQMIMSKYHRSQQLANNEKMMKMSMSRMQPGGQQMAGTGYGVQPQHQLPQGMGPERGMV